MKTSKTTILLLLFVSFSFNAFSQEWRWQNVTFDKVLTSTPQESAYQSETFNRRVDFRRAKFISTADFHSARFKSEISFRGAQFKLPARFQNTRFYSTANFAIAKFLSKADFSLASFKLKADFSLSEFASEAVFYADTFSSTADFSRLKFGSNVTFANSSFYSEANFKLDTFDSTANFLSVLFDSTANFERVVFEKNVSFGLATFISTADFEKTEFASTALFNGTVFNSDANFKKVKFDSTALFKETIFNSDVNFSDAKFNSLVSFESAQFLGETNFSGDTLPKFINFSYVIKIKNEIDFTASIIETNKDTCNINLVGSAIDKIRFRYKRFKLWFPEEDSTGYELKANVYQQLLEKQKAEGFTQSYVKLDKEYREFQYTDPGAERGKWGKFLNWVDKYWWGYGYDKERIIWNTLVIFLILSIINSFFLKYLITQVYSNEKIIKLIEKRETKNGVIRWFDSLRYSIFYTAVIFFSFNFDLDKLNYAGNLDGWKVLNLTWFMFVYLGGFVCMAYLANYIITV